MNFFDFAFNNTIYFQNPASSTCCGILDLHNYVMLWLIIIFFPLVYIFFNILKNNNIIWEYPEFFNHKNKINISKIIYLNTFIHGSTLEVIWTIIPAIILIFIAIPSFALLYAIDETIDSERTIKIIGNQWFWQYEFINSLGIKKNFSSYMIATKDLIEGAPRLLDVDYPLILNSHEHLRFIITSNDVLHAWAVPSLGIKMDAVPGRLNQVYTYF